MADDKSYKEYTSINGEPVHRSKFAYVGDPDDKGTWKLPLHDEAHVRNALARFGQTDLPSDQRKEVARRIVRAAKAYGIDTQGFEEKYLSDVNIFSRELRVSLAESLVVDGKQLFRVSVALTGTWVKNGRKFSITRQDLADMARNFLRRKNEMIVIDFEHASEMPEVARGGPIPAAGWIHALALEGGTLDALIEWTEPAKRMIESGQYRFFSPAIDFGATDKATGEPQGATLTSGALTNRPFLEELPAIALTDGEVMPALSRHSSGQQDKLSSGFNRFDLAASHSDAPNWEKESTRLRLQEMAGMNQDGFVPGGKETISVGFQQPGEAREGLARKGGRMKKLHLKKSSSGSRTVLDDEGNEVGEVNLAELDLDDDELGQILSQHATAGKTSERLAEIVFGSDAAWFSQARRTAVFSETLKGTSIDLDKAAELADAGEIGIRDYRQIQRAQELVERAISEGKFMPVDREFISRLALTDAQKFEEWVRKKTQVAPIGPPIGVSGPIAPTGATPDQELWLRVAQLMSERGLSRKAALDELVRTEPDLVKRYREGAGRVN